MVDRENGRDVAEATTSTGSIFSLSQQEVEVESTPVHIFTCSSWPNIEAE